MQRFNIGNFRFRDFRLFLVCDALQLSGKNNGNFIRACVRVIILPFLCNGNINECVFVFDAKHGINLSSTTSATLFHGLSFGCQCCLDRFIGSSKVDVMNRTVLDASGRCLSLLQCIDNALRYTTELVCTIVKIIERTI